MKNEIVLFPEYMVDFKCIGSNCEDTCCVGWNVNIDKATHKKYRSVKNKELSEQLRMNIKRNKVNPTETNYSSIKLDNELRCPFLNGNSLCSIHSQLGEDYLSHTCTTYPRSYNNVDGVIEKSAVLSCPEIARKALLGRNGIEFTQTVETINKVYYEKVINTHSPDSKDKFFTSVREFSIGLIQNRNYSLDERLIILGIVLNKIHQDTSENKMSSINKILSLFKSSIQNVEATKKDISSLPLDNNNLHIKICNSIIELRAELGYSNNRYLDCFEEMINGIEFKDGVEVSKVGSHYLNAKEEYYAPFFKQHEYILENYIVHTMFQTAFPLKYSNIIDDYVMLVIHYVLIKLHLVGMAKFHEGITINLVLKLIQSFTKEVDHHSRYLQTVYNFLKDNNVISLGYMAVLIRS